MERLWERLTEIYGMSFTRQFGDLGGSGYVTWLEGLSDVSPEQLKIGIEKSVKSGREFPPNLTTFRAYCMDYAAYGLPSLDDAYHEAARAPYPVTAHRWSHPAVYHAGADTGWFELRTLPAHISKKKFEERYAIRCKQVAAGEELPLPDHPALENKGTPASKEARERFRAERLARVGF